MYIASGMACVVFVVATIVLYSSIEYEIVRAKTSQAVVVIDYWDHSNAYRLNPSLTGEMLAFVSHRTRPSRSHVAVLYYPCVYVYCVDGAGSYIRLVYLHEGLGASTGELADAVNSIAKQGDSMDVGSLAHIRIGADPLEREF